MYLTDATFVISHSCHLLLLWSQVFLCNFYSQTLTYLTFVALVQHYRRNSLKSQWKLNCNLTFNLIFNMKNLLCVPYMWHSKPILDTYLWKMSCWIYVWKHIYIYVYLTIKPSLFSLPILTGAFFFFSFHTPSVRCAHTLCVCGDPIRLAALHTSSVANNCVLGRDGLIKDFLLTKMRRSSWRLTGNEMEYC